MTFCPSRFLVLTLTLLFSVMLEAEIRHRPFQEKYTDPDTGIRFPSEIGGYRKTEVVRNFNPFIGTVIRYADVDGGCADIYIYSLDSSGKAITGEQFMAHFRNLRKTIENLSKKSSHVTDVQTLGEENFRKPPHVFGRQVFFRMNIAGDLHNSDLAVFPFADKIVKIRISSSSYYSSGEKNRFSFFMESIAKLFNNAKKQKKTKKIEKK